MFELDRLTGQMERLRRVFTYLGIQQINRKGKGTYEFYFSIPKYIALTISDPVLLSIIGCYNYNTKEGLINIYKDFTVNWMWENLKLINPNTQREIVAFKCRFFCKERDEMWNNYTAQKAMDEYFAKQSRR